MEKKDVVVWITGASSGIGEALAYTYAGSGARLILSARNVGKLEAVRSRCSSPERHLVLPLDLTDQGSFPEKTAEALGFAGRIDILINNGGVSQRSFVAQTSIDVDRRIMETNFFGTVALTKAVLPSMLHRKAGHIAVISSVAGKIGTPLRSAYCASKHALHGFFDALRAEVWREGISVTIVCPGFIKTDISVNALNCTGNPHGVMDDAQACGMLPDVCALKIIEAIDRKKPEVYIGGREIMGIYLKRYAPSLLYAIMRKAKVT